MDPARRERGLLKVRKIMRLERIFNLHDRNPSRMRPTLYPDDCDGWEDYYADDGWRAKRIMDNRKVCSCWMCGNPRKYFNQKTYKETVADADFQEQLDDYFKDVA